MTTQAKKTLTVRDFVAALIADETPKCEQMYYTKSGASCAVGGAAKNLGVVPDKLGRSLAEVSVRREVADAVGVAERVAKRGGANLFIITTYANDYTDQSKPDIGRRIDAALTEGEKDAEFTVRSIYD